MKKRDRKQSRAPLPLRYILPRDLREVKVLALASALEAAWNVVMHEQLFTDSAFSVLVATSAIRIELAEIEGKRGSNDSILFCTTFIEFFFRVYPRMLEAVRTGAADAVAGEPPAQRIDRFYLYAQEHVSDFK